VWKERELAMPLSWRSAAAKFPAAEVRTNETREQDERFDGIPVRGFLWTLFFFKMATVAVIFWAAGGSGEAGILLSATTWPWLIIPAIVVFGWLLYHIRMRRVRARRRALIRSEWMVDERETIDEDVHDREGVNGWRSM
jgi:type VI protein secretion system component VasK